MSSDDLIKQTYAIEHALEAAMGGVHNSQEWGEPWTAPYANGHGSYGAWIEAEFQKLRHMAIAVNSHASLVEENKRMREALKPFAQIVEDETMMAAGDDDADEWFRWDGSVLTVGDFRRAKKALGDTNA